MSQSAPVIDLIAYLGDSPIWSVLPNNVPPWALTASIAQLLREMVGSFGPEYVVRGEIATHRSATIAPGAVIEGPAVLSRDCAVAPNAYLRGGVFVGERARIGFASEVKASYLFQGSVLAHLNYVGDSLIGAHSNLEAGAVIANHYNERADKEITVVIEGRTVRTGIEKFGALVGHHARIGANAVTSPGTILPAHSIVRRLALVEQTKPTAPARKRR